jgi:hypothetical protein
MSSILVFGIVALVAFEQGRDIGGDQIDLAPDGTDLAGMQAPQAEIRMKAAGDALKEFLIRLPSGGEYRPR